MVGLGVGGIHEGCEGMPGSKKAGRALGVGVGSAAEGGAGSSTAEGLLGQLDRRCQAGPRCTPPQWWPTS